MRSNVRFKYCAGELVEIMISNLCIFENEPLSETAHKVSSKPQEERNAEKGEIACEDEKKRDGRRRAAKRVYDLVRSNPDLDLFCTFTLDQTKIDRYDYKAIVKKLNNFLDNHVRRDGLKYVLVAERHKDGAIHFHALMNQVLKMVDSGKTDKGGHKIFNLPQWGLGFTTAIVTYGNRDSVCKYITKYITKSDEKVGGRWYYHGGKLSEPSYEYDTYLLRTADELEQAAQTLGEIAAMTDKGRFGRAYVYEPDQRPGLRIAIMQRQGG